MIPQTLFQRLESLYRHLDEEGWHVHANTVALVIEEIEKMEKRPVGRPPTGFDKKAYDRDRMRRIRAQRKLERNPGAENMIARGQELK